LPDKVIDEIRSLYEKANKMIDVDDPLSGKDLDSFQGYCERIMTLLEKVNITDITEIVNDEDTTDTH
jgi:hypothetical protein